MLRPRFALALVLAALPACASDVFPADAARRDVVDVACPPERPVRCSGECVGDTDSNPLHCGASCAMCDVPAHGGATCAGGVCGIQCSPGYVPMDGRCVDAPAPRPIRPLSNARVSVTQPTLRWANPSGTTATHVTLCRDRACSSVVTEFDAAGTSARVPNALGAGVWFWNLRAIDRGTASAARSATWSFHTPAVSGPVEWSWAERPDYNGDGFGDLTADYPDAAGTGLTTEVFFGGRAGDLTGMRAGSERMQPIGDVDGDGFSDFVSIGRSSATLYAGAPDLTAMRTIQSLSDSRIVGLDYFGWGASTGDFDGDGFSDVLLLADHGFVVAHGSATGWVRLEPLRDLQSLVIGFDVDADGFDDVLASDRWWRGGRTDLGAPRMIAPRALGFVLFPMGDLDGDGYLDAAVLADQDPLTLLRGSAAGPAPLVFNPTSPNEQRTLNGDAGDLNGDGFSDLLFWGGATGLVAYRGTPNGYSHFDFFVPTLPCTLALSDWGSAHRIGDFDASGSEDYVLVCRHSGEVFLHLDANTPSARWLPLHAPGAAVIE